MRHVLALLAILAAIAGAAYMFREELAEALYAGPPRMIVAEVRFINNCPVADSNFVLKDASSGRTVPFSNGLARIEVLEGTPLQIQLTARFTEVQFNGATERARPSMRMVADCDGSERERGTVRSLNDALGR